MKKISCDCCSLVFLVETVDVDEMGRTFTLKWNGDLIFNGGIWYDPEDNEVHSRHFFYNDQLYTTELLRHVLRYKRTMEDEFKKKKERQFGILKRQQVIEKENMRIKRRRA